MDKPLKLGVLVHGDNHFIVRGPLPSRDEALRLVRHWSVIQIGQTTPEALAGWRISTREFREELEWVVVVPGESEITDGVAQLLDEMRGRGVAIRNTDFDEW